MFRTLTDIVSHRFTTFHYRLVSNPATPERTDFQHLELHPKEHSCRRHVQCATSEEYACECRGDRWIRTRPCLPIKEGIVVSRSETNVAGCEWRVPHGFHNPRLCRCRSMLHKRVAWK